MEVNTFDALKETASMSMGFAGYATVNLLSLANRCFEFGMPDQISAPIWSWGTTLLNEAMNQAHKVRDPEFRNERIALVQSYNAWMSQSTPDIETVREMLSKTPDPDTRRVYKDLMSARWSQPDHPNLEGLKALVPMALADGTLLDAVLARLFGLCIGQLSDEDVAEAIRICMAHLATSRPWELGQWR